jgi:hypothetical protein
MHKLQDILDNMEPGEALTALTPQLKRILSHLDEEARADFVIEALGGAEGDKVGSLVDL